MKRYSKKKHNRILIILTVFVISANAQEPVKKSISQEACSRAYIFNEADFRKQNTGISSVISHCLIKNGKLFKETSDFTEYLIYSTTGQLLTTGFLTTTGINLPKIGDVIIIRLLSKNNSMTIKSCNKSLGN